MLKKGAGVTYKRAENFKHAQKNYPVSSGTALYTPAGIIYSKMFP